MKFKGFKGFNIQNLVSADLYSFRNINVTTCSAWPQIKLFADKAPSSNAYRP